MQHGTHDSNSEDDLISEIARLKQALAHAQAELLHVKSQQFSNKMREWDDERIMERKIQEQQRKDYEMIFNSVPAMIWLKNEKNIILRVNEQASSILNLKPSEMEGRPITDFYGPSTEENRKSDLQIMQSGQPTLGQIEQIKIGDQQSIWVRKDKIPYYDEVKGEGGILVVAQDISDIKHAEEELKSYSERLASSNQALEDFAYIASHDLQEPLRTIISYGNIIQEDCSESLSNEGMHYLKRIQDASFRLRALIEDLLDYSKIERRPLNLNRINLREVFKTVTSDLDARIKSLNAVVDIFAEDIFVMADDGQMYRAFQNIISNSLKFSKKDVPPHIKIEIKSTDEGKILIEIIDNGIGFNQEFSEEIFHPFRSLNQEVKGNGIGLAVVRKIVERHNGLITAEGNPGVGSIFHIKMPISNALHID